MTVDATDSRTARLWFVLALPVLAGLFVGCLFYGAAAAPPAARSLATAVCTMVIAYLMWPMLWIDADPLRRGLGSWASATAAIAALLVMARTPAATWPSLALPLGAGVLIVCWLLGALTLFLHHLAKLAAPAAHRAVFIALLVSGTAPLWLGPLAATFASRIFAGAVVALSPAGYLAALIDYDALRSAWFYTNTPWGGLRYDYPEPVIQSLVYGALALSLYCGAAVAGRRAARAARRPHSPLHLTHKELKS